MMLGMSNHHARAIQHIQAVQAAAVALRDEYEQPEHDRATIADLNAVVSRGLKLAEVEATLAVAEAITSAAGTQPKVGVTMERPGSCGRVTCDRRDNHRHLADDGVTL